MKTKDIRDRVTSMGFERGIVWSLEAINEQVLQTQRDLKELAHYFDKMVDSMEGIIAVAGRMKESIERNEQKEEELGANTNSLDKE